MSGEREDRDYYIRANNANQHLLAPWAAGFMLASLGVYELYPEPWFLILTGFAVAMWGVYGTLKLRDGTISRRIYKRFSDDPAPPIPSRSTPVETHGGERE